MKKSAAQTRLLPEILLSLSVLALLLAFTYAYIFETPYSGFYINPTDGRILEIYQDLANALRQGDVIKQIGPVSWVDYYNNARQRFFEDVEKGQVVEITLVRDAREMTVLWGFPGFNWPEFRARALNIWWLAYIFWFFGMVIQLFMRPKDTRWFLLIGANYLTAFWVINGTLSASHIWGSSLLLHALTWLALPVYLHLHWIFPKPLARTPAWLWGIFYLAGIVLAAGEFLGRLPRPFYFLGFLLILVGSVVLLVLHYVRQPDERRAIGLLAGAIGTAVIPSIVVSIIGALGKVPQIGPLALLALPVMPGAYFFVVYRRQLQGMELRTNRLVSIYTFLVLLGTLLAILVTPALLLPISFGWMVFLTLVISLLTSFASIRFFPVFQAYMEQRFLGIRLPYQNLQEAYSSRIITSTSLDSLVNLLEEEILPSLLVREFGFLQIEDRVPKALLAVGVDEARLLDRYDFSLLMSASEKYRPAHLLDETQPYAWARLILPLKVGKSVIGFWLLGRRDPDDLYAQAEIPILRSLANQTAIALSNLMQTERLRAMYQANVNRYEEERLDLALDLHDSILNQMAVLMMNLDLPNPSPKFQEAYDGLTQRLREIVSNLRPPMLNYGLEPAIRELADNLMERSQDTLPIRVDLQTDGSRYPLKTEMHLFRIVQEACENSLRHARAANVVISGRLSSTEIALVLQDDGVGFNAGEGLQLESLIANKHFGLAGMIERAAIIGAEVGINSQPGQGTVIRVALKPGQG
ncbi:MAG: GAF domain-containing sensor histidine kinase [Chloroflexota bacterium]